MRGTNLLVIIADKLSSWLHSFRGCCACDPGKGSEAWANGCATWNRRGCAKMGTTEWVAKKEQYNYLCIIHGRRISFPPKLSAVELYQIHGFFSEYSQSSDNLCRNVHFSKLFFFFNWTKIDISIALCSQDWSVKISDDSQMYILTFLDSYISPHPT